MRYHNAEVYELIRSFVRSLPQTLVQKILTFSKGTGLDQAHLETRGAHTTI